MELMSIRKSGSENRPLTRITDNFQKSDELEKPGKIIIKYDYDEFIENK